jgi:DNA-binding LacI/PurR family transcriptional regulator
VINHDPRVLPHTRQRVEQAIQELDYAPNAIARLLATGASRTLACLSPNLTDFTFASLIEGAELEARQHGYFVITSSAPDLEAFQFLIEQLIATRRVDGLVVLNPYIDERYMFLPPATPVVFVGAEARQAEAGSVMLDEVAAGGLAARHLLQLGHTRIAHLTGPQYEDCSQGRLLGFNQALLQAGLETDPDLVLEGDWSASAGYAAIGRLLAEGRSFSALFAQNDRMAVGAINALQQAGLRVPEDVSVIGFDDMPLASYFDPPLTTIRQDFTAMGGLAARLLIQAIEAPVGGREMLRLGVELVPRGSTARCLA